MNNASLSLLFIVLCVSMAACQKPDVHEVGGLKFKVKNKAADVLDIPILKERINCACEDANIIEHENGIIEIDLPQQQRHLKEYTSLLTENMGFEIREITDQVDIENLFSTLRNNVKNSLNPPFSGEELDSLITILETKSIRAENNITLTFIDSDTTQINTLLRFIQEENLLDKAYEFHWKAIDIGALEFYILPIPSSLTVDETMVVDAKSTYNANYGQNEINITFNEKGAKNFEALSCKNIRKKLAIVLDGTLLMAPYVQECIGGGKVTITFNDLAPAKIYGCILSNRFVRGHFSIEEMYKIAPKQ